MDRSINGTERNDESGDEHLKELFARFGLAYYQAECLHRGLCNLYVAIKLSEQLPVTSLRVEEHQRDAFGRTLGQIAKTVQPYVSDDLWTAIDASFEQRNFLAHHFWYERAHLMVTVSGVEQMIRELSACTALFENADRQIALLVAKHFSGLGISQEFVDQQLEDLVSGRGAAPDPLIQRRKPNKKEEIVVGVYEVQVAEGRSMLVFETEDGLIWQLCDAGLGWAPYDQREQSWKPSTKFAEFLPARVNPRPPRTKPWHYNLQFGRAILEVRLGEDNRQILYKFRG